MQQHRSNLPSLEGRDSRLLDVVRRNGAAVTTLDGLGVERSDLLRSALTRLAEALAERDSSGANALVPTRAELLADTNVWQWGLDERLLDIVENYIGLPVRYYGANVRREIADGEFADTRQWHRDVEDHRMFKILVWLDDVDENGGPFEYVERTPSDSAVRSLHYVSGFVGDDDLEQVVPRPQWRAATGPRWTAVMSDTAAVLHRARPPVAKDRYSVTFSWTSRRPRKTVQTEPFSPAESARIRAGLTPRQLACLPREVLT